MDQGSWRRSGLWRGFPSSLTIPSSEGEIMNEVALQKILARVRGQEVQAPVQTSVPSPTASSAPTQREFATSPSPDPGKAYRWARWHLGTLPQDAPRSVYDEAVAKVLLQEAALPPLEVQAIHQEEARRFHAKTGRCPFCLEEGELHLPAGPLYAEAS